MTTMQMHFFIETAKRLNFTAAAESLYVTQPTLSRQIIGIEQELNVTLFIREKNSVVLTPAGQALYHGLQKIYDSYLGLVDHAIRIEQGFSGSLHIALAQEQVMSRSLKAAVRKFHLQYPEITISIKRCDLHTIRAGLLEGRYDIVNTIFFGERFFKDLKVRTLSDESGYFAIEKSFPMSEDEIFTASECVPLFHDYPLILPVINNIPGSQYDSLTMWFRNNGIAEQPVRVKYLENLSGMAELVALGLGVAFVNETHGLSEDPNVRMLRTDLRERYQKAIVYNPLSPNPVLIQFLQFIEREMMKKKGA